VLVSKRVHPRFMTLTTGFLTEDLVSGPQRRVFFRRTSFQVRLEVCPALPLPSLALFVATNRQTPCLLLYIGLIQQVCQSASDWQGYTQLTADGPARAGWARERFKFIHNKFRHLVDGWCVDGCWITLAQCDSMETDVQASSGWMVRRQVLNHSGPVWSDGNQCLVVIGKI